MAWTLCVEMSFYFFIPLYAKAVGWFRFRVSTRKMLGIEIAGIGFLIATSLLWQLLAATRHLGLSPAYQGIARQWLPAYLELFGFGMALAVASAWFHRDGSEPAVASSRLFPWVSWTLGFLCFIVLSNVGANIALILPPLSLQTVPVETLEGVFALFLLLPAVFGPQELGLVRRFLTCWPMMAMGVISYGIYLWHVTWCEEIMVWSNYRFAGYHFSQYFAIVLALTLAVATVSYFALEKPVLKLKRRFTWFSSRSKEPQPPSVQHS